MNTATSPGLFSVDWIKGNGRSQNRTFEEITQPVNEELDLLDADSLQNSIKIAAYYLALERLRYAQFGDALSDWLEAERTVQKNRRPQTG